MKPDSLRFVSQIMQRERANALGSDIGCETLQRTALRGTSAKREPKLVTYIKNKLVMHCKRDSVIKTLPGTGTVDAQGVRRGTQSKTTSLAELTF